MNKYYKSRYAKNLEIFKKAYDEMFNRVIHLESLIDKHNQECLREDQIKMTGSQVLTIWEPEGTGPITLEELAF